MTLIYADTCFWVSYLMPDEENRDKVVQYVNEIIRKGDTFLISNLVLQECIRAIRKKYAIKVNEQLTQRILMAKRLSRRNDPQGVEMQKYMKEVETKSKTKHNELVYNIVNDITHFTVEQPHNLSAFGLFAGSLSLINEIAIGWVEPVFPRSGRLCRTCYSKFDNSFLIYKAVDATDVTHLLLAIEFHCKRFVTRDEGFSELVGWASPKIEIEII